MKPAEVNVEVESDGAEISVRKIRMTLTHLPTQVYVTGDGYNKKLLRDSLWKDLEKKVAEHLALPTNAPVNPPGSSSYFTDRWYRWHGGNNPAPGLKVSISMRSGSQASRLLADTLIWAHSYSDIDIVYFLIHS